MGIEEQIDRLIDLGEDIKSRLDLLFELASDHFAGANKMVAKEPAKEASLDGLPDIRTFAQPNLRWRILEPGEVVCSIDWVNAKSNLPSDPPSGLGWRPAIASVGLTVLKRDECVFARPVADEPAKEPEPAWEPKVGDWVRVTRPENWKEWKDPLWREEMHIYDGKVFEFVKWSQWSTGQRASLQGIDWFFHRDWLSPAEPPAKDKPADEPPKKWRILGVGEEVQEGDRVKAKASPPSDPPNGLGWCRADPFVGTSVFEDDPCVFARLVADEPAKEPEPAWEPKVGDWVRVTRPERPEISDDTPWLSEMDRFDGKVMQVARFWEIYQSLAVILAGTNYAFKIDWLSPAEPPATEKPAEPEYRQPVLPADYMMTCEFSNNGNSWGIGRLGGWLGSGWISCGGVRWRHCRIKKDA